MWKRRQRDLRARGGVRLQGNKVFQAQQGWCRYKHTEAATAHTSLVQVQIRQNPSAEKGKWTERPTPNHEASHNWCLLGKKFLSLMEPHWVYQAHPGKCPCPGVVGWYKSYSMLLGCFFIILCLIEFLFVCLFWVLFFIVCYLLREKEVGS